MERSFENTALISNSRTAFLHLLMRREQFFLFFCIHISASFFCIHKYICIVDQHHSYAEAPFLLHVNMEYFLQSLLAFGRDFYGSCA